MDEQGGVANLGNLHGVLRFLVGDTASMEGVRTDREGPQAYYRSNRPFLMACISLFYP